MKQKSKGIIKCIMTFVLTVAMVLGAVPLPFMPGSMVAHAADIALSGSDNYTAQDGDVLTGSTSGTVTIAGGAKITLNNATITGGIVCDGTATITLAGTNSVTGVEKKAGIEAGGAGTTLTIKGDGSLTVTGGKDAAGIGLSAMVDCNGAGGNIVIEDGSITAYGGINGAGIGTGDVYASNENIAVSLGNIMIKGGIVSAYGGTCGAGIGAGSVFSNNNRDITVNLGGITIGGGMVTAVSKNSEGIAVNSNDYAYGIGKGQRYGSSVTINIDNVTVTDEIYLVDASSIGAELTYIHKVGENETNVTNNHSDYFYTNRNGERCSIVKKDDTEYTITIDNGLVHGTIQPSSEKAKAGEFINLVVTPEEGYMFQEKATVTSSDGYPVTVNGMSFVMPKGNVTVNALSTAVLNAEGVLTLSGTVDAEEVKSFAGDSDVEAVVCEPGTVFPPDCSGLFGEFYATAFDLSDADISNVTNMNSMFENCNNTTTIYVGTSWDMKNVSSSEYMFHYNSLGLMGGNGTGYSSVNYGGSWAVIDKSGQEGYMTGVYSLTIPDYMEIVTDAQEAPVESGEYTGFKIGSRYLKESVITIKAKEGYSVCNVKANGSELTPDGNGIYTVRIGEDDMSVTAALNSDTAVFGHSLTLNGQIGVNTYMFFGSEIIENPEDYQVEFRNGGTMLSAQKVSEVSSATKEKEGRYYTVYGFSFVTVAKEADAAVNMKIKKLSTGEYIDFTNSDGSTVSGNTGLDYSVNAYLEDRIANSQDPKMVALAGNMRAYCIYAKHYFDVRDNDSTESLPEIDGFNTVTADTLSAYAHTTSGDIGHYTYKGSSLLLRDQTSFRLYFESDDTSALTITVGGESLPIRSGKGMYYVEIKDIAAKDLDTMYDFTVSNGAETATVHHGPMGYAYWALSSSDNENLKYTMMALYQYNRSAENYFKNN
ncbi:MAG: BspA family leucine-rich repeat surface protein [Lachnospiraceae bacterium]|nr:BspA family leucine-rich repeat surface protein [Lachnospiraceae bacterium]